MALILVVEDDPSLRAMYEVVLPLEGHATVTAGDGTSAIEAAGACDFDLIVMDLQLPDMHGYNALRRIKAESAGVARPAIVLTGDPTPPGLTQESDLGVRFHLAKPFQIDDLLDAVERAANEHDPVSKSVRARAR